MKTLRQIREEYNDKFLDHVDSPDEFMFESTIESPKTKGGSLQLSKGIPSSKQMPVMLLFRRISYRIFPDKQVVALYYSHMIDKYMTIPFGPGGNINLSEAVILEKEQLDEFLPALATAGAAALRGAVVKGAKNLAKRAVTSLAKKAISSVADDSDTKNTDAASSAPSSYVGFHRPQGSIKTGSSWKVAGRSAGAVAQSKLRQADLKQARQVQENKISDIRTMLNSGAVLHEMNINGKTVTLNNTMAKRILEVYDSVNTKNKKIVEGMLNEDLESFKKLLTFSIRN